MPPAWLFKKFNSIALIAYDDTHALCYIQVNNIVYEVEYRFLENAVPDEAGLLRLLSIVGQQIYQSDDTESCGPNSG